MVVVITASTPFLTPIGHQADVLAFGPDGSCFFDSSSVGVVISASWLYAHFGLDHPGEMSLALFAWAVLLLMMMVRCVWAVSLYSLLARQASDNHLRPFWLGLRRTESLIARCDHARVMLEIFAIY